MDHGFLDSISNSNFVNDNGIEEYDQGPRDELNESNVEIEQVELDVELVFPQFCRSDFSVLIKLYFEECGCFEDDTENWSLEKKRRPVVKRSPFESFCVISGNRSNVNINLFECTRATSRGLLEMALGFIPG